MRWFNNFEFYMVVIPPSRWARTGIPNGVLYIEMPIILSFHSKMWHDIFFDNYFRASANLFEFSRYEGGKTDFMSG